MNKGIFYAITSYFLYGLYPIYFKMIENVPALQVVGHRLVWSFVFLVAVVLIRKEWPEFSQALRKPGLWLFFFIAALLITTNWLIYVYSVQAGYIVEASMGYYINPLVTILLGLIVFRERLRNYQWLAVGLATIGVVYMGINAGHLPWIALGLAFSFGLYGLAKKKSPINAFYGLTMETIILLLPSLVYLLAMQQNGAGAFWNDGLSTTFLLILAGPITILPLLLFGASARLIDLSMLGFIQYITPTIQLLIGVIIYREPFTHESLLGFSLIWIALIILSVEGFLQNRKTRTAALQTQSLG